MRSIVFSDLRRRTPHRERRLVLVSTLAVRLQLERLANGTVRLSGRIGGSRLGRKVMTLVQAIVAGGSRTDHCDVLCGGTEQVLAFRVMAPSTLGTFLRAFTFGHVRQLEAVVGHELTSAWDMGAGPGRRRLVVDVDSALCEVNGKTKQGAADRYTKVVARLGYRKVPRSLSWSANRRRGLRTAPIQRTFPVDIHVCADGQPVGLPHGYRRSTPTVAAG